MSEHHGQTNDLTIGQWWWVATLLAIFVLAMFLAAHDPQSAPAGNVASTSAASQPVPTTQKAVTPQRPDALAWGNGEIKNYDAEGEWSITDAKVNVGVLTVSTPYYDKAENRGAGPAAGLCTVYLTYAQQYGLTSIVILASDGARLFRADSTRMDYWSHSYPAWSCHPEGG
jgi:hypothetical protein